MKHFWVHALLAPCLLFCQQLVCPNNLFAQAEDQAEEKPAEATAADFDDLQKQFTEIEDRLKAIVRQLRRIKGIKGVGSLFFGVRRW